MNTDHIISPPVTRGLLHQDISLKHFTLQQFTVDPKLKAYCGRIWLVEWDLPVGKTYQQSNLPHPCFHLVIDPQKSSGLFGCTSKRFDYPLTGNGFVLGVHFHPGAGQSLLKASASILTDTYQILEKTIKGTELLLQKETPMDAIPILQALLRKQLPPLTADAILVRNICDKIENDPSILRVADLANIFDHSIRSLQRLFSHYVGVSPKWVIDRHRMFNAVSALDTNSEISLADLAVDLGYTDQAHFSHRFKALTGFSPNAYLNFDPV